MKTENLQSYIHTFIAAYGESALREAMQQYIDDRQIYICRAKSHIARIPIRDICYLEIAQHNITIHTTHEVYKKIWNPQSGIENTLSLWVYQMQSKAALYL